MFRIVVYFIMLSSFAIGSAEKDMEIALAVQNAIKAVTEKVAPSVVCIKTIQSSQLGEDFKIFRHGNASGVIISPDGYILTNDHVVREAKELKVTLDTGKRYEAELVKSEPRRDLAIIKIEAKNLPVAKLSKEEEVSRGMLVVALGSPFGFGQEGQASISFGIVSAKGRYIGSSDIKGLDRYYGDMIQTDAAINPGNSGGPLCNLRGEVIGINTVISTRTGGSVGVGFAIPVNKATREIINKLLKGEEIIYGYLGAYLETMAKEAGALIRKVMPDSPADKAGLGPGDLVIEFENRKIKKPDDLVDLVGLTPIGKKVELTYIRKGKKYTTKVIIAERPSGKK